MNKYYQEMLKEIKAKSGQSTPNYEGFGLKYVGTDKPSYHLDTKTTQQIAKYFLKSNALSSLVTTSLLDSLYHGKTYDEINIAAKIIQYSPKYRLEMPLDKVFDWLGCVHGWAEGDTLCQMAFTDHDLLSRWPEYLAFLKKLNHDTNIHRRRASLVLLTKPVRLSSDSRLSQAAFQLIENLQSEKDILITKAVSWILRSLIKHHRQDVESYIVKNRDRLPKIALREVSNKLITGKKTIKKPGVKPGLN